MHRARPADSVTRRLQDQQLAQLARQVGLPARRPAAHRLSSPDEAIRVEAGPATDGPGLNAALRRERLCQSLRLAPALRFAAEGELHYDAALSERQSRLRALRRQLMVGTLSEACLRDCLHARRAEAPAPAKRGKTPAKRATKATQGNTGRKGRRAP